MEEKRIKSDLFNRNMEIYLANMIDSNANLYNMVSGLLNIVSESYPGLKESINTLQIRFKQFNRLLDNTRQAYLHQNNKTKIHPLSVFYLLQYLSNRFKIATEDRKTTAKLNIIYENKKETSKEIKDYLDSLVNSNNYIFNLIFDNIIEALLLSNPFKSKKDFKPKVYLHKDNDYFYFSFPYKKISGGEKDIFKKRVSNIHDYMYFGLYVAKSVAEEFGGDLYYERKASCLTLKLKLVEKK